MRNFLVVILLVISASASYADSPSFSSDNNLLLMPEVNVNGRFIVNVRLKLETNGQYVVEDFTALSDDEEAFLVKIKSLPCGPADTLGRLAARNAFVNGNESYCLVSNPTFTIEGGRIVRYLLIENGTVQIVVDNRLDGYGVCCFHSVVGFTELQFGFMEDGVFIEQTAIDQIDFERKYILQLIGEGAEGNQY
ncbi:MAG: hypothetical protein DRR19_19710 [Candidatus Parabeggiatoa sp. nov. 1]|nr:MAG: hypothetical protein DRR19_19710 [Gammaproteobacteria bacterium]